MYKVGIRNAFQARHFLRGDFGPESVPHEHRYALQWVCSTEDLDENGFAVDIALLEELLHLEVESVRGKLLNELEFFRERQPSVENMARFFLGRLRDALAGRGYPAARIVGDELTIWESDSAWASFSAP
jgi:6-pyruvoyltetrahydropterin/6-carboxytetrahydropterin synthase